ncbi:MAG: universal stress protein [Dehalococcoidia bacterium]|nr:universal stress protein [Dehalococcoidia bacterium]
MRRTLVATTDGSARSFCVFPHAARLADACGLELCVLHVVDDTADRTAFPSDAPFRTARQMAEAYESISEELRRLGIEASIETQVKPPAVRMDQALLDAAVNLGAVALAMDSRGQGLVRTAVAGSTALRVLAESHMPVLMTAGIGPPEPKPGPYEIMACTDGSARADAIGPALALLFRGASASIAVLQVADEEPGLAGALDVAAHLPRWFAPETPVRTVRYGDLSAARGTVAGNIAAAAAEAGVDVLALATRGFRLSHRIARGSTGIAVLGQSPVPVLFAH